MNSLIKNFFGKNYSLLLSLSFVAYFTIFLSTLIQHPYPDSSRFYWTKGWFNLVQSSSNALLNWHFDPLFFYFLQQGSYELAMTITVVIGWIGFVLWSAELIPNILTTDQTTKARGPRVWLSVMSTIVWCAICMIFGYDVIVLPSLAWFCWHLWALQRMYRKPQGNIGDFAILIFVSYFLICASNQYALGLIAVSLFVNYLSASRVPRPLLFWTAGICLSFACYRLLQIPVPTFPSYPATSSVVPPYGTTAGLYPRIGPELSVFALDKKFLWEVFSRYAPICCLLLSYVWFISLKLHLKDTALKKQLSSILLVSFALTLMLVCDSTLISAELRQLGPLASLSRMIPTWIYTPLSPMVLGILLILLGSAFSFLKWTHGVLGLIPIFSLALTFSHITEDSYTLRNNPEYKHSPWKEVSLSSSSNYSNAIITPSYGLFARLGLEAINREQQLIDKMVFRRAKKLGASISASHNTDQLVFISDGKRKTRWSSGQSKQDGTEWIHFRFRSGKTLQGMRLRLGKFYTDFPRCIAVFYKQECSREDRQGTSHKDYLPLVAREPWLGPVKFTPENAPYYGSQSDVQLVFPADIQAQCILVKQTGKEAHFEWSVTEVGFAVASSDNQS